MHITASIVINDNESSLIKDFQEWLEKLAPQKKKIIITTRQERTMDFFIYGEL